MTIVLIPTRPATKTASRLAMVRTVVMMAAVANAVRATPTISAQLRSCARPVSQIPVRIILNAT
jgi:hypothetical protein